MTVRDLAGNGQIQNGDGVTGSRIDVCILLFYPHYTSLSVKETC